MSDKLENYNPLHSSSMDIKIKFNLLREEMIMGKK